MPPQDFEASRSYDDVNRAIPVGLVDDARQTVAAMEVLERGDQRPEHRRRICGTEIQVRVQHLQTQTAVRISFGNTAAIQDGAIFPCGIVRHNLALAYLRLSVVEQPGQRSLIDEGGDAQRAHCFGFEYERADRPALAEQRCDGRQSVRELRVGERLSIAPERSA